MPRVSVIVPVHDVARYLEQCLDSVTAQTLRDIEIICIDDCSSDGSADILARYAAADPRLRVITYTENKSASQARKDGALSARGEYVLFIDADDTIAVDALERLCAEMRRDPVDVLHFGARIVNEGRLPAARIEKMEEFLSPYPGKLTGPEIIRGAFSEPRLYNFTLWDKLFSAELCRRAFSRIRDGRYPKAQDKYAYFVLSYFAQSYRGVPNIRVYDYHFGRGVTGHNTLTPQGFARYCSMALVADAVDEFVAQEGGGDLEAQADVVRRGLLVDCASNWMRHLAPDDAPAGFDMMVDAWGASDVASVLSQLYRRQPGACARRVRGSRSLETASRPVRTVATYYHRYANGGVQRVLSLLIALWREMGYEVVLITSEPPTPDDYEVPDGVSRVVIPYDSKGEPPGYYERARALASVLQEYRVDTLVYHAWSSPVLLWDLLVCKCLGVPFTIHCHSVFSQPARSAQPYFADMPSVYPLADGVVALSEVDRAYWSSFNPNVVAVVNPFSFEPSQTPRAPLEGKTVLWIGRLSEEKRPKDALEILAKVLGQQPDARMEMVGSTSDPDYMRELKTLAHELGVEDSLSMPGFQRDVMPYYTRASVLLLTSEYEGFPQVLTESQSSGLPGVMYELPYLTLARGGRGLVAVEMGDVDRAADAVADLLADEALRTRMGDEARANAEALAAFDFEATWRRVIEGDWDESRVDDPESIRLMWEMLFDHYRIGAQLQQSKIARMQKEIRFAAGFSGIVRRIVRGVKRALRRLRRRLS